MHAPTQFITTCESKQNGFHLVHPPEKAHAFAGISTRVSPTSCKSYNLDCSAMGPPEYVNFLFVQLSTKNVSKKCLETLYWITQCKRRLGRITRPGLLFNKNSPLWKVFVYEPMKK